MADPQTVADTDAGAKPKAEDASAQEPSIDELLEQFKVETPTEQQPQKSELKADDIKKVVDYVEEVREKDINTRTDTDIAAAAKTVKGDLDLDDELVTELLHGKASRDVRFLTAFQQRHQNPSGWNGVLKAFGKELASKMVKPDKGLTDDRAAVEHAVRSAATGSPDESPPNFGTMTDPEFNKWKRDHGM